MAKRHATGGASPINRGRRPRHARRGTRRRQLTTSELASVIRTPGTRIIDVRSVDAYNGWPERGEIRGGHIAGAKSLPAKWADYLDWIEIVRSKGLLPEQRLVLYGYDSDRTESVAALFQKAGYSDVDVYHDFVDRWSTAELPMQRLPRYRHLVSAPWLHRRIEGRRAQSIDGRCVVCHAHYQNRPDYEQGHIPGAIDLDTNRLESPETWNRRSPPELMKTLENLGITYDTTVVLYGRFSDPDNDDPFPGSSAGHLGAMRSAFILLYAGVEDVRILNGGLRAWLDAGFELTTEEEPRAAAHDFGASIPGHPEYAVDLPEAEAILADPQRNLVCVRSRREYLGEVSGYHYIEKKGRIPGAVFDDGGSDAYHMENYRNLDHTTREYHEIAKRWARLGVTPDKRNAFYCGTGWRGSEAFFNAWLMGWPDVAVFDGGWFEWSNNDLPCETGELELCYA